MSRHEDLLTMLGKANPDPVGSERPEQAWTAVETLEAVESRTGRSVSEAPTDVSRRAWWSTGPLVAAAAAVVVLLVGLAVLVVPGGEPADVASRPGTTTVPDVTAAPTTAIAPQATTSAPQGPVTTVPQPPAAPAAHKLPIDGMIADLIVTPLGLVALEQHDGGGGAVWTLDGDAWTRVATLAGQPIGGAWFANELWISGSADVPTLEVMSLDGTVRRAEPPDVGGGGWLGAIGVHDGSLILNVGLSTVSESPESNPNFFRTSDGDGWVEFAVPLEPPLGHLRGIDEFVSSGDALYVVGGDIGQTVVWRTVDLVEYEVVLDVPQRWAVDATIDGGDVLVVVADGGIELPGWIFRIAADGTIAANEYPDLPVLGPLVADGGYLLVTRTFDGSASTLWIGTSLQPFDLAPAETVLADPEA